jgi:peptide chain release factor 1
LSKELLFSVTKKDFEVQTFRCSGAGGQNVNKVNSGVRIVHRDSGAVGESREERSQLQNKKNAFKRLTESKIFKLWLQKKIFEINCDEKEIERKVDREMNPENLKVEIIENGKWKSE